VEIKNEMQVVGHRLIRGAFQFLTNGAADPVTLYDPQGVIQSITYSATGIYTIVFKPRWLNEKAVAWVPALAMGTPSDSAVYKRSWVASTGTLVLQTFTAGVAAAIAAAADNAISVVFAFFDGADLGAGATYET
jgi:hypothetical protein